MSSLFYFYALQNSFSSTSCIIILPNKRTNDGIVIYEKKRRLNFCRESVYKSSKTKIMKTYKMIIIAVLTIIIIPSAQAKNDTIRNADTVLVIRAYNIMLTDTVITPSHFLLIKESDGLYLRIYFTYAGYHIRYDMVKYEVRDNHTISFFLPGKEDVEFILIRFSDTDMKNIQRIIGPITGLNFFMKK